MTLSPSKFLMWALPSCLLWNERRGFMQRISFIHVTFDLRLVALYCFFFFLWRRGQASASFQGFVLDWRRRRFPLGGGYFRQVLDMQETKAFSSDISLIWDSKINIYEINNKKSFAKIQSLFDGFRTLDDKFKPSLNELSHQGSS